MTSALEIVALAKRAGPAAYGTHWVIPGLRLIVRANGELTWLKVDDGKPLRASWLSPVVFDLRLDASNTASPEALTRALLASALSCVRSAIYPYPIRALLGGASATGKTEAEARDALLDSLLAEVA